MNLIFKQKMIAICDDKILKKGSNVGLSFYSFFSNKNDNPDYYLKLLNGGLKLIN